jgi:hypothetical protein
MTTETVPDPTYSRRWLILAVVGVAQVMVVLDTTDGRSAGSTWASIPYTREPQPHTELLSRLA